MSEIFLKIVNMSISASWLVLAVLLLRLVLKKAPKWVSVLLWGLVAVRLICPFSFESMLSLIPSAETISPEIMMDPAPEIHTGIGALNSVINPIISESLTPDPLVSANPLQIWIPVAAIAWIAGVAAMLIYTAVSYFLLRHKVATAVLLRNSIFQSENVDSPFVLGIIKPKIYLPFQMNGQNLEYVIAHEESHIRRKDHWWKPFGFLLLAIHWFNPLLWLGYILLCRDIELACDEKVIKEMDNESKADYTQALVACSVNRRSIAACPVAFGEVGVKERVKSVMNYKKPAFWIVIAAVVTCIVVAVCFLTNPKDPSSGALPDIHSHTYVVEEVTYEGGMYSFSVVAGENSPIYVIAEDMSLASQKEHSDEGAWAQLGKLEETELTKENFDELFSTDGWVDKKSAKSIRKNTVNAWQLIYNQEVLYYVLQQKNGDLYLVYGYTGFSKNDAYSDDTHIRWLYKLGIDTNGSGGIIARSGDNAVPMVSFPAGTVVADYVDSVYWLTIDPGEDEIVPFTTWRDGEEVRAFYNAFDAETFEPIGCFVPSGLDSQTYLFQNADLTRSYIVLATFSTEPNAEIYAFGAKFDGAISSVGGADAPSNVTTAKTMTLDDVFELATKGNDLTWEDLQPFRGRDAGSWLYAVRYDIDSDFYLLVADEKLTGTPMNVVLCVVSGDQFVDIREGDVKGFVETYRSGALDRAIMDAIAAHYRSTKPDGLIHTQSYVHIGNEIASGTPLQGQDNHFEEITAYLLVKAKTYSAANNTVSPVDDGVLIPTMIRFGVDAAESYQLLEYWTPSTEGYTNGAFNHDDVREKFPEGVAEEALTIDRYEPQLNQSCDFKASSYLSKIQENYSQTIWDKYPEYFRLNTDKGLAVYVYQMTAESYSCVLVSGGKVYTWDELWDKPSTTLDEMRQIVQSYRLDRSKISIIPIKMPYSSYPHTIDDAYRAKLEGLFWAEYQDIQEPLYKGLIDSVSFDIDGDGKTEMCTLGFGPTSGLCSFTLLASPMEVTAPTPKYFEMFVLRDAYTLSFEITDGVLRIRGDKNFPSQKTVYFDIAIKDGHIVLQCEEEGIFLE